MTNGGKNEQKLSKIVQMANMYAINAQYHLLLGKLKSKQCTALYNN